MVKMKRERKQLTNCENLKQKRKVKERRIAKKDGQRNSKKN